MIGTVPVRVTVLDSWEDVPLTLPVQTTITEVKRAALAHARVRHPATEYLVKFRGAELAEGNRSLADSGVTANSALIVLRRRRNPAR